MPFVSALFPLVIGAVWYSNFMFGKTWFRVAGMTEEKMKSGNMIVIFILTYIFGLFLSNAMVGWSIHQFTTRSLFVTQEGFAQETGEYYAFFQDFISKYGDLHRSFGHGAVHGVFAGIAIALPLIAINALFERRGWKYILIHAGYWIVTLALMCGFLCEFV